MAKFKLFSRRRGVALLAIVLVGFVVLSIVAAVAMNIAGQTTRIEAFQTQNLKERRLDALARSAAVAVAEAVSADGVAQYADANNSSETGEPLEVFTDSLEGKPKVYLSIKLKRENNDYDYTITSVASSDKKVTLTLKVVSKDGKLTRTWGKGK